MAEDRSVLRRESSEPDLVLAYGPGPDDVADVRLGSERRPLIVMLHGGFWRPEYDRGHVRPTTAAMADAGYTVVAPEYRRIPGRPDASCEDVRVALRVLPVELRGRYDGRVVVVGHSAGGHLALWAASAAPAAGLHATLALAPVTDLVAAERDGLDDGAVAAFLGGPATGRPDLDPIRCASAARPVHLVHGLADSLVPPAQSEAYVVARPAARLVALHGAGHFDLIDPLSAAWPRVLDVLRDACEA